MFEILKRLRVSDFNYVEFDDGRVVVQLARYPFVVAETQEEAEKAVEKIYEQHTNLEFRFWKLKIRRYRILDKYGNGTSHVHIKWRH